MLVKVNEESKSKLKLAKRLSEQKIPGSKWGIRFDSKGAVVVTLNKLPAEWNRSLEDAFKMVDAIVRICLKERN